MSKLIYEMRTMFSPSKKAKMDYNMGTRRVGRVCCSLLPKLWTSANTL